MAEETNQEISLETPVGKISTVDLVYLAGFLDGEGCFSISYHEHGNVHGLSVEQTDGRVLEWCSHTFGGNLRQKPRRVESREQIFEWVLRRKERLIPLLTSLIPYLKVKKVPATILLEYCTRFNRSVANKIPYTEEEKEIAAKYIALIRIANSTGSGSTLKKQKLHEAITSAQDQRPPANITNILTAGGSK